jgi:5,10-methylenetetrahydromethanopterin reductase
VHADGAYVRLDGVRLDHPPDKVPPVFTGVRGARSLALSGRVADGTILSEPSAVPYVGWAREQIAATRPHRLTVYAWCSLDHDGNSARAPLRPVLAERLLAGGPQVEQLGIAEEVTALADEGGARRLAEAMPDEWLDSLAVVGTPDECAAGIRALGEAGAHAAVPVPLSTEVDADVLARELLPALGR